MTTEELEQTTIHAAPFQEGELYTFSVVLCVNEVDRDGERFTIEALHRLGELFLGKTGIFDHNPQVQNQAARIYACQVEQLPGRVTKTGEAYHRLVARAYLPRSQKNETFILELDSGIKKEVSVGCSVAKRSCSICGADRRTGGWRPCKRTYLPWRTVLHVLEEPTDAYEWSFVAVPAQREAGVNKNFQRRRIGIWRKSGKVFRARGNYC